MNKKTKGLISGIVGAGLLIGAGGTFALWFDTAAVGPEGDSLATGQLNLTVTDYEGQWVWEQVSNDLFTSIVGDPLDRGALLVPGDTVTWEWTDGEIEALLSGDTIVANLYLEGVEIEDIAELLNDLAPLTVTWNAGTFDLVIGSDGSILLESNLTADSHDLSGFEAPTFTVNFQPAFGANTGFGYLPAGRTGTEFDVDSYGDGYARGRSELRPVDLTALSIRLQQVVTSD